MLQTFSFWGVAIFGLIGLIFVIMRVYFTKFRASKSALRRAQKFTYAFEIGSDEPDLGKECEEKRLAA